MKFVIIFATLAAFASAAPASPPAAAVKAVVEPIPIVKSASDSNFDGSYSFSFETGNEINREEVGEVRTLEDKPAFVVMRGSWSYKDPEGQLVEVKYFADETGFHPEGSHIPTVAPAASA